MLPVLTASLRQRFLAPTARLQGGRSRFNSAPHVGGAAALCVAAATSLGLIVATEAEEKVEAVEPVEEIGEASAAAPRRRRRRRRARELPNPGKLDDCGNECREVLNADVFQGAKFDLGYCPVAQQTKQIGFNFNTHLDPQTHQNGAQLNYMINVQNQNTHMLGRLDNSMGLFGRAQTSLTDNTTAVWTMQFGEQECAILECDYTGGKDWTTKAKYMKSPNGHNLEGSYFQSITPSLALGIDCAHTLDTATVLTMTGRYKNFWNKKTKGDVATVQLNTMGIIVGNFTHKVDDHVSLATEMTMFPPRGRSEGMPIPETMVQTGIQYKQNTFRYQANFKTTGEVSAILDYYMQPTICFSLSGVLNHSNNDNKFGMGLRFG